MIPNDWKYDKARRFLLDHKQGYYTTDKYVDEGVKLLRITDLTGNGNVSFSYCPKVPETDDLNSYLLSKGDFVFARTGGAGTFGLIEDIDEDVVFASYLIRFRYNDQIYPKFLKYNFQSSDFYHSLVRNIHGGVNQNIHAEDIKDQKIFIPPIEIQNKIAHYLDKETTRIDTLIVKKEKQISLLREKRQMIITQSVTKGLNQEVKMKDSGVDWIGEIPDHWKIIPIKYLGKIQNGYAFNSNEFSKKGVRVMKISNIQTMRVDWEDESFIDNKYYDSLPQFRIFKNDLVFALTRPIISTGIKACIVDNDEKILLNQRNAVLRPSDKLNMKWMYYIIIDKSFTSIFEMEIDKTGQQPNISTSKIGNLKIPLPEMDEQNDIVEYLDRECGQINFTIQQITQSINLLKEYRSSLITHVVSGQIDISKKEV